MFHLDYNALILKRLILEKTEYVQPRASCILTIYNVLHFNGLSQE